MTSPAPLKSRLSTWLFDQALPLWASQGVSADGRFQEQLDFDGQPVTGLKRRTRVQARQIYVFCEAAALGWEAGRAVAATGLEQMIATARRDDGLWVSATDDDGAVIDATPDLYDLAFVLFALAAAHRVLGDARALSLARETLSAIHARMSAATGGWEEALPPRQPRRQNPHMHLLEAMLAWQAISPDPLFLRTAETCLTLCRDHFLVDGAIREFFTADWAADPETGHIIEPGHLAEWAWLITQAERLQVGTGLIPAGTARQLSERAFAAGTRDGFLMREIGPDNAPLDDGRRLWAQTEGLRTALLFDRDTAMALAETTLDTHLATRVHGLWIDSYDGHGEAQDTTVPASSLYHLMTAITEVLRTV